MLRKIVKISSILSILMSAQSFGYTNILEEMSKYEEYNYKELYEKSLNIRDDIFLSEKYKLASFLSAAYSGNKNWVIEKGESLKVLNPVIHDMLYYNLNLPYDDVFGFHINNQTDLLGLTYNSLIADDYQVPESFALKYPNVLGKTYYSGDLTDEKFKVAVPEKIQRILTYVGEDFDKNIYDEYINTLITIRKPNTHCYTGDGDASKLKDVEILKANAHYDPSYYTTSNFFEDNRWLEIWSLQGLYEEGLYEWLSVNEDNFIQAYIEIGKIVHGMEQDEAEVYAYRFSDALKRVLINNPYSSSDYDLFDEMNWVELKDNPEFLIAILYKMGRSKDERFHDVMDWIKSNDEVLDRERVYWNTISNIVTSFPEYLERSLQNNLDLPDTIGVYNKSPIIYSIEKNDEVSYDLLMSTNIDWNFKTHANENQTGCFLNHGDKDVLHFANKNLEDGNFLRKIQKDFLE